MVKKLRAILKAGMSNSAGSVTVEAGIILPVILLLLFSMVIFSMSVYHKLVMLDTAVYTAAQRAETWDNSGKNLEDGYLNSAKNDGLYWRLVSDLSGYVSKDGSNVSTGGPQLVSRKSSTALGLAEDMLKYQVFGPDRTKITVQYRNIVLRRIVSVNIYEKIIIPVDWISNFIGPNLTFMAEADVVEPAEFIRKTGLAEKYLAQILEGVNNIPGQFTNEETQAGLPGKMFASKGVQYGRRVRVYHYQGCRYLSRIKAENLIDFDSPEQANASEYYLCWECAKRMIR